LSATDMQLAIEKACSEAFVKTSYNESLPDILGVHEGYTEYSEEPLSNWEGRQARDNNKTGFRTKRTDYHEVLEWPRTKEPHVHRVLMDEELGIHKVYQSLAKEPEWAFALSSQELSKLENTRST